MGFIWVSLGRCLKKQFLCVFQPQVLCLSRMREGVGVVSRCLICPFFLTGENILFLVLLLSLRFCFF